MAVDVVEEEEEGVVGTGVVVVGLAGVKTTAWGGF